VNTPAMVLFSLARYTRLLRIWRLMLVAKLNIPRRFPAPGSRVVLRQHDIGAWK